MNKFTAFILYFWICAEIIHAQPEISVYQEKDQIVVKMVGSDKDTYVSSFNDEWIGVEFQLWSSGRGVLLYSPADAKWRRGSAFINAKWKLVPKGKSVDLRFKLKDALSDTKLNDEFAKKIYDSVPKGGQFDIVVITEYSDRGDGRGDIRQVHKKVKFEKL